MTKYIIKLTDENNRDYYLEWSSASDAPATKGMELTEFRSYYQSLYGSYAMMEELSDRLARVEEKGVSTFDPDEDLDSFLQGNRAGDNEEMLSKQEIIAKYCHVVDTASESEIDPDPNGIVFLKGGLSAFVPLSQFENFVSDNWAIVESRRITGHQPRRRRLEAENCDCTTISASELLAKAIPIVQRTARVGLDDSLSTKEQRARWFYIWCGDVAGELGEVWEALLSIDPAWKQGMVIPPDKADKVLTELGDVLWGITALALLCEIPIDANWNDPYSLNSIEGVVLQSLGLLDIGKKICRDGIEARPIDSRKIQIILAGILRTLIRSFDMERALELVDAKLQKRYPNGFSAQESVDRGV